MSILDVLYTLFIEPLRLIFEVLYMFTYNIIGDPGFSIVALSLMMNFLVLPLYMRADAMQEHERDMEARLHDGVAHIKATFKGDEKVMMLQTYYRQNDYRPTDVFKGSISLFLEIPFFISAYIFLSNLGLLRGVPFGPIPDLGSPDGMLTLGGLSINVLPFIMTGVNLVSCAIFTKQMPRKTKIQLYGMAAFFLVFLYASPAGLVFYWTLNNVFALIKTIFYKLKNPKKVLVALFAAGGAALVVTALTVLAGAAPDRQVTVLVIGIGCMVPAVVRALGRVITRRPRPITMEPRTQRFVAAALLITVLMGFLIPSAVISSSPQEFVFMGDYLNPVWYVVRAACLAAGLFLVWFDVFYWLCNRTAKVIFEAIMWVACGFAVVDYLFFGTGLGILSGVLQYENGMSFNGSEMLLNAAVLAAVAVAFVLVFRKFPRVVPTVLVVATVAFVGMAGYNTVSIKGAIEDSGIAERAEQEAPAFTLSKQGHNVVVLMLDRALGELTPYLMAERPELQEQFSGFTYYPNTISFGGFTNFGTPALFGGYEYTPEEMNKRDQESLCSKQNEALKVMPVLFDQSGYRVTVCDPSYANYQWIADTSIYDDYPDISTYVTDGYFTGAEEARKSVDSNMRNFFCFSFVKCLPVAMQPAFYNDGLYNSSTSQEDLSVSQTTTSMTTADGRYAPFLNSYRELESLESMTQIDEGSTNTFLMMTNLTTHEPVMLQEPDYTPADHVDNSAYEGAVQDRTADGQTLAIRNENQVIHYHVNMAALIQVGKWLDYLKANGVYDNTRIIIVADHGTPLHQRPNVDIECDPKWGYLANVEFYHPLLLVKDFGDSSYATSEEFMTNGDVPTLATSGLVENPENPFTGKPLSNAEKTSHPQHVYGSEEWDVQVNNGNTYLPGGVWFSVSDDMRDPANWTVLGSELPER